MIQLQIELPNTHFIVYQNKKYPVKFDVLKNSSKYFSERQDEIIRNENIYLFENDTENDNSYITQNGIITFIKYIQLEPIQLTNDNIISLNYLGHKYEFNQLISSTEDYIKSNQGEICLKLLVKAEKEKKSDNSIYEEIIANDIFKYMKDDGMLDLEISTLYRIFMRNNEIKEGNEENENERKEKNLFLLKILSRYGIKASILFKFADIKSFDDEILTKLLNEYSNNNFEFGFICPTILKLFFDMKNKFDVYKKNSEIEFTKIKEELNQELLIRLEENKRINEEINKKEELNQELLIKLEESKKIIEEMKQKLLRFEKQKNIRIEETKQMNLNEIQIMNKEENNQKIHKLITYLEEEIKKNDKQQEIKDILLTQKNNSNIYIKYDSKSGYFITNKEKKIKQSDLYNLEETIFISPKLKKILSEFSNVYFDIQYPSSNFESIYNIIAGIREFKISIFYFGVKSTDQHFRRNKRINIVRLDSTIDEIKSEKLKGSFEGCTSLSYIDIPSSVTSIGSYSFNGCSSLKIIDIPSSIKSIGSHVFEGCSSLINIYVFSSVEKFEYSIFKGCTSLESINIPSSVKSIGSFAFYGCTSLKSIEIPSSVEYIGDDIFNGCSSLVNIKFSSSVASIGNNVFKECSSLAHIDIPSSVTSIGCGAFYNCEYLNYIKIPSSVTSMGNNAFVGCTSLMFIEIPSQINSQELIFSSNVSIKQTY